MSLFRKWATQFLAVFLVVPYFFNFSMANDPSIEDSTIIAPGGFEVPYEESREIFEWSVGDTDFTLIKQSFIIWSPNVQSTLPAPEIEPIFPLINAKTYVIEGKTVPDSEVTVIGGPFQLPPVRSDNEGRFSVEVPLKADSANKFLIRVINEKGEFSPALSVYIVESPEAKSDEEYEQEFEEKRKALGLDVKKDTPSSGGGGTTIETKKAIEKPADDNKPDEPKKPIVTNRLNDFKDVSPEAWFYVHVNKLRDRKIISGYGDGRFGPSDAVTRGQMIKIATNAALGEANIGKPSKKEFVDVGNDNPFYNHVHQAKKLGWIAGFEDGSFGVNQPVNRSQAAKIMVNAFGFDLLNPDIPTFSDVTKDKWFYPYVETLVANGIVQGNPDGTFAPNRTLNRAEISKMTVNAAETSPAGVVSGFKPKDLSENIWQKIQDDSVVDPSERVKVVQALKIKEACPYDGATIQNLKESAIQIKNNVVAQTDLLNLEEDQSVEVNSEIVASTNQIIGLAEDNLSDLSSSFCREDVFRKAIVQMLEAVENIKKWEEDLGIDSVHVNSLNESIQLLKELAENSKVKVLVDNEEEEEIWSGTLKTLIAEANALLGSEITISTDCEEYKKKAARLKDLQNIAKERLKKAQQLKAEAQVRADQAEKAEKAADERLKQAEEDKKNADKNIEKTKDGIRELQDAIIKSLQGKTNAGIQRGTFGSRPEGWQVDIGANTGSFPLFGDEGLHIRDEAALDEYLKAVDTWRDDLNAARDKYKEALEKKENADKNIADAKANQKAAQAANKAAQAALKAACKQLEEAEAAIATLNVLITTCNNKYKECVKIVFELKLKKQKAENSQNNADKAINGAKGAQSNGESGVDRSQSNGTLEEAEEAIGESKDLINQGLFEEAKEKADQATALAHQAKQESMAEDCIKKCEDELRKKKAELAVAKKKNPKVNYSDTQALLDDAQAHINSAKRHLKQGGAQKAKLECRKAKQSLRRISSQINQDEVNYEKSQVEDLNKNAAQACYEHDKKKLEDAEVLALLKEYQETIEAIINALGETDKGAELLEKLFKLAKRNRVKIKDGDRAVDVLKKVRNLINKATKEGGKLNEDLKELNEFLEKELFDYLKDELKDPLINLAAQLAARGLSLSSGPAKAMAALWGEAWALGDSIGNWIADQLTQIIQSQFEAEVKVLNLCNPPNTTAQGTGRKLPVKIDWYVEVIDESGNPIKGAKADLSAKTSETRTQYDGVETLSKVEGEEKLINHIPIPSDIRVDKVMCPNGKTAKVIKKYVTVKRHCASDHIQLNVNVRLVVSCD